jgi:hypothetical protein
MGEHSFGQVLEFSGLFMGGALGAVFALDGLVNGGEKKNEKILFGGSTFVLCLLGIGSKMHLL